MGFTDRYEAGLKLSQLLTSYSQKPNVIVLALPRGGVPVGYTLAKNLRLPLDVYLVRKLGVPGQPELALGAIALDNTCVFNQDIIQVLEISQTSIDAEIDIQKQLLAKRNELYRQNRSAPRLMEQTIILVDDGLATGASMRVAISALKLQNPKEIIVAVPVAPASVCQQLAMEADEVICLQTPQPFHSVGTWYENFTEVSDDEVIELLQQADSFK